MNRTRLVWLAVPLALAIAGPLPAQEKTKVDMTAPAPVLEPSGIAPAPTGTPKGSTGLLMSHDSGKMTDRLALNASGSTVEFNAPEPRMVTAVQFFGARYGATVKPTDTYSVVVSDAQFKPIIRIEKPLLNLSPSRETWQTVAITPAAKVDGRFYITLIFNSNIEKGIYVGVDEDNPSGDSKVGVPGTVASDVDSPLDWMIRASTQTPAQYEAVRSQAAAAVVKTAAAKKPAASASSAKTPTRVATTAPQKTKPAATATARPAGTVRPGTGAAVVTKGNKTRMSSPQSATSGGGGAKIAYRDPHRRLSFTSKAPALRRGCGRVDVTWNVSPVTVELSYVGKPPKIIENLDVKRFAVDFPVPEPGLFSVVIRKAGYQPAARQFRVVSGSRQEWHVTLQPGSDTGAVPIVGPSDAAGENRPVMPTIEDSSEPLPEAAPVISPENPNSERSNVGVRPNGVAPAPMRPRPENMPNGVGADHRPTPPATGAGNGVPIRPPAGRERPLRRPLRSPNGAGVPAPPPSPDQAPAPPPPAPAE
ncbi:MAG: hypothetical protein IT209_12545 [Armatimonadetes bacterium]|nr:hypothetical protein [Armatimonadota bacterium]